MNARTKAQKRREDAIMNRPQGVAQNLALMKPSRTKRFKVWVEIEELKPNGDHKADGSELGILPDCVGSFEGKGAKDDAIARIAEITKAFGDAAVTSTSDSVKVADKANGVFCKRYGGLNPCGPMNNPKVITYCDFGEPGRKSELSRHKTIATAMRQYARIWDIYGRLHGWRVWQEPAKRDELRTP